MAQHGELISILTALNVEYQAVRDTLTDLRIHGHPSGTLFELGRLRGSDCQVALGLVGKGNHASAVIAERTIAEFAPAAMLFVGVAGGLRPSVAIGDVIVATHVYAYHGGTSEDDGLKARPRVWEISHGCDQLARHLDRSGEWAKSLPEDTARPRVHFGPIAAGEVVQNSRVSEQARWVRDHYNDALAIEMEAAGVAQAAHLNRSLPVIVVRGISDLADGTKEVTDRAQWQARAVANAAAFATALVDALVGTTPKSRPWRPRGAGMSGAISNVANGNARVAIQAGHIHGNVRIAPEPPDRASLPRQLFAFPPIRDLQ